MASSKRMLRDTQVVTYCRDALKAAGVPPPPLPVGAGWEHKRAAGKALDSVFIHDRPSGGPCPPAQAVRLRTPEGLARDLAFVIKEACTFHLKPHISVSDGYKGDRRVDLTAHGAYVVTAPSGQARPIHEIAAYLDIWLGWRRDESARAPVEPGRTPPVIVPRVRASPSSGTLTVALTIKDQRSGITTLSAAGLDKLLDAYPGDAPVFANGVCWAQDSSEVATTVARVRARLEAPVQRSICAIARFGAIWTDDITGRTGIASWISSAVDVPAAEAAK